MLTAEQRRIVVRVTWDPDAKVWVATSDDVPGLAAEADTLDATALELDDLIPELLALNNVSWTTEGVLEYCIEVHLVRTIPKTR